MGGYRFLDHIADVAIEAYGDSLNEAFENAAKGICDTMVDLKSVRPIMEVKIDAEGHDLHSLLFDWLDKVLLLLVADGIALSQFSVRVGRNKDFLLTGVGKGEKLDIDRHHYKVEIKAVTYHGMEISDEKGKASVKFLLDV